jgi:hypothetical protein
LFAEIADRNYPIPVLNTLSYISNQESARVTEGLMEEKDHVLVCGIEESEYSLRYLLNASLRVGAESRTMETIMTQFFMVHAENKELSDFLFSVILRKYNSLVVNVCLSEECCVWTLSRVLQRKGVPPTDLDGGGENRQQYTDLHCDFRRGLYEVNAADDCHLCSDLRHQVISDGYGSMGPSTNDSSRPGQYCINKPLYSCMVL